MSVSRTLSLFALLTLSASLLGCPTRSRGSGIDDDDDATSADDLAGLDDNGDGALTDADVSSGQAATYFVTTDDEGDTESGSVDSTPNLSFGDGMLGVFVDLDGAVPMTLSIWFDSSVVETGSTSLSWAEATSEELLVWVDSSSGTVTVTDSSDTLSGYFEGTIEVVVADQFENPTGQVVRVEALAFNQIGSLGR